MNIIKRSQYLQKLDAYRKNGRLKVITGLRRVGKSTLMSEFANGLDDSGDKSCIHSYNFENPNLYFEKSWKNIYDDIVSKLKANNWNYVFLDEVQNIDGFEKLIDGLFIMPEVDLYVTGSNAYLLSSEYATLLTGRYIELHLLPFSFSEYCLAMNVDIKNKYLNLETAFQDYIDETSLPKGVELSKLGKTAVSQYLRSVYATIVEKDIFQRAGINKQARVFTNILRYIIANIGSPLSPNNIANALKSDGQNIHHLTVEKYIKCLTDCYFLYEVSRFDIRGKMQLATQEKYYLSDLGFRNIIIGRDDKVDRGHLLENIVYLELLRRDYQVWVGKANRKEVDFIARNKENVPNYFQVAYTIKDAKTLEREISALKIVKDNYPKTILTTDNEESFVDGIEIRNVYKWLLS
ncbi:MAG: ATP-binding protein [Elusimicrobiota bacterium]|jgi:predicted AAA+ superfamily ATPase|nr:ATP-binding protein [Elusimicrobiota bacterium]